MKEIRMTIPDHINIKTAKKQAQKHLLEKGLVKDIGTATEEHTQ